MNEEPLSTEELHQLIDQLTEKQTETLKDETMRLVREAFAGLDFDDLDRATDKHRAQYNLLKQLSQGPMIGMVRAMVGDISYQDFAKLMIFLGCTAIAQDNIHAAVRRIAGQQPAAKPQRFQVDLTRLPKFGGAS